MIKNNEGIKLNACPFCAHNASIDLWDDDYGKYIQISCNDCYATMKIDLGFADKYEDYIDELINNWEIRAKN